MIFSINRNKFLTAISNANKVISLKTNIPALFGILIEVEPNRIILTSSDTEIAMRIVLKSDEANLDVKKVGVILVKAKILIDIVRKISSPTIILEVIENSLLTIKAENFVSDLNLMDATEFPQIGFALAGNSFKLKTTVFNDIYNDVCFAASDRDQRPILNGINLNINNDSLISTATDSFRLAKKQITINNTSEQFNLIIPKRIFNDIIKLITIEKEIEFFYTEKNIIFKVNEILIKTKLIEGTYPDLSKAIPKKEDFKSNLNIKKVVLSRAIERASVLSHGETSTIVKFSISKDKFTIKASAQEIGNSIENLQGFNYNGNDLIIAFNSKYVIDALKAFKDETIQIHFIDEFHPAIIDSKFDKNLIQLVLPVRTF